MIFFEKKKYGLLSFSETNKSYTYFSVCAMEVNERKAETL
jgi:hypothetical protein